MFYISNKYSGRPTQVVYEVFLACSNVDNGVEEKSTWCLLSPKKSVFRVMSLKILTMVGFHIFKKKILEKYNFMHFERHFAFQNA